MTVPGRRDFLEKPRRKSVFGVPPSTIQGLFAPVILLDLDVDPGMRIDPFHLRDFALQVNGLFRVELGRERVMRRGGDFGGFQKRYDTDDEQDEFGTHDGPPLVRRALCLVRTRSFQNVLDTVIAFVASVLEYPAGRDAGRLPDWWSAGSTPSRAS